MIRIILSICLLMVFSACKKDTDNDGDCSNLSAALAANDREKVRTIVMSRARMVGALSLTADYTEKQNKVATLARQLTGCGVEAEVVCVSCIDTNPPMSEITLRFTIDNVEWVRTIDLFTEAGRHIEFIGVHE